jgi:hypothetical protein
MTASCLCVHFISAQNIQWILTFSIFNTVNKTYKFMIGFIVVYFKEKIILSQQMCNIQIRIYCKFK